MAPPILQERDWRKQTIAALQLEAQTGFADLISIKYLEPKMSQARRRASGAPALDRTAGIH